MRDGKSYSRETFFNSIRNHKNLSRLILPKISQVMLWSHIVPTHGVTIFSKVIMGNGRVKTDRRWKEDMLQAHDRQSEGVDEKMVMNREILCGYIGTAGT